MPPKDPIKIAIIGAGIAGITLAIALSKTNPSLKLTIFESRLRFSEISAGVGFGPNAIQAMNLISPKITEAYEKVETANFSPEKAHVWYDIRYGDGPKAGEMIAELKSEEGFLHCNASRAQLLAKLVELLPESVEVRFGKRIIDVMEDEEDDFGRLRARFEDQTDYHADAVVGCDGIRSACRKILLGEDNESANAVYSGKYAYRKVVDMKKAVRAVGEDIKNRQMLLSQSSHAYILTDPIRNGKALNVVAFRDAEGVAWKQRQWIVPSSQEAILKDFEGWGERAMKVLKLIENPEKWGLFDTVPAKTYASGNFVLLGDAAHATTPHLDAGAGFAIEDAHLLSGLLTPEFIKSPSDIKNAFRAWDEIRRPRCKSLIEKSRQQGNILDLLGKGVGDINFEEALKVLEVNQHWVWDVDLAAMLEQAIVLFKNFTEGKPLHIEV